MRRWALLWGAILVAGLLAAPSRGAAATQPALKVVVSIPPQAYFVERIGGDLVDVAVLLGPGRSPATFDPTPRQMARLARARVYFRIGVPFETAFLRKMPHTFRNLLVVDTRQGVPLRYFGGQNGRQVPDPHVWLDPGRVKIQAQTIRRTLAELDPAHQDLFRGNMEAFLEDMEKTDREIRRVLAPFRGRRIFVFHPAFGYFCDAYGLVQVPVEREGKEPGARRLKELIARARREGVRVLFVQPQFSRKEAEAIAREIGGVVIPLDPLPRDYLEGIEELARRIRDGLTGQWRGRGRPDSGSESPWEGKEART